MGRLRLTRRPGGSKLVLRSRDPALTVPAPGSPDDPAAGGVLIELFSPLAGNASLGVPTGPEWQVRVGARTIYRYRNSAAPGGPSPVYSLQLATTPSLKIVARSAGLPLTSPLGQVGIRIRTGDVRHCALFVPDVDVAGRFVAADTLPLANCSDESLGGG